MQELEKGLGLSVAPELRKNALERFETQIGRWALTMPQVEPLVLDFGLGAFEETGLIEFWICNEVKAGYCGKYLFVFDGQTCPMHRHKHKVETFFIVRGSVNMQWGDQAKVMTEGETLLIEPWTPHAFTGAGPALLLEVSTPCLIEDNYFENPAIPIGSNYGGAALQSS